MNRIFLNNATPQKMLQIAHVLDKEMDSKYTIRIITKKDEFTMDDIRYSLSPNVFLKDIILVFSEFSVYKEYLPKYIQYVASMLGTDPKERKYMQISEWSITALCPGETTEIENEDRELLTLGLSLTWYKKILVRDQFEDIPGVMDFELLQFVYREFHKPYPEFVLHSMELSRDEFNWMRDVIKDFPPRADTFVMYSAEDPAVLKLSNEKDLLQRLDTFSSLDTAWICSNADCVYGAYEIGSSSTIFIEKLLEREWCRDTTVHILHCREAGSSERIRHISQYLLNNHINGMIPEIIFNLPQIVYHQNGSRDVSVEVSNKISTIRSGVTWVEWYMSTAIELNRKYPDVRPLDHPDLSLEIISRDPKDLARLRE